jgi:hypothetical protein
MSYVIARLNAGLEGRYRIEREVGEGGVATVYRAEDMRHRRKVAVKVLKPDLAAALGAERLVTDALASAPARFEGLCGAKGRGGRASVISP